MWRAKTERALRFLAWQRRYLASKLEDVARLGQTDETRAGDALEAMLARYEAARTLLDGATVVLLGPPNSGKSTLFNQLLGRPATVVSPHPGTTRDWVSHAAELKGVPLTLVDTAGRREDARSVERQAIERGETVATRAHLRLIVLDGSQALASEVSASWKRSELPPSDLVVVNKVDLGIVWDPAVLLGTCSDGSVPVVRISALTGAGMEALVQGVTSSLGLNKPIEVDACLFTSRQKMVAEQLLSDLADNAAEVATVIRQRLIGQ
jgi:tRNA modification GTPase